MAVENPSRDESSQKTFAPKTQKPLSEGFSLASGQDP
jgi:hypothetical protein